MDSKGEELRGAPEERPNRVPAFKAPQALAFPHCVLREERRQALRVVLVIAIGRIPRLEVTDGVDIFQDLHSLFELCQAGSINVLLFHQGVPPVLGSGHRRYGMRHHVYQHLYRHGLHPTGSRRP